MSVTSQHEDYIKMLPEWIKCIDFTTSEKAVHDKGELYLPKLTEQEDDEYKDYKRRAPLMMYAQRAAKSMVGMVSRKETYVEEAERLKNVLKDFDDKGNDFNTYCLLRLGDFLKTGRGVSLVDLPDVAETLTVAQAEAQGIRPRVIYYPEVDVINWKTEKRGNETVLTLVVLREKFNEDTDNEFTSKTAYRYRVLDLVGTPGTYRQRLLDDTGNNIKPEKFPKKNRQFMNRIPAVFHGGVDVMDPPLNAVIDLNKHHYMLGADEIHGLRAAALPTPYLFGEDPKDKDFPSHVGPTRMIGSEKTDAKIGYLEFTGMGLASVANKLQKFEDGIIMLSVQVINETPNQSATTSSIDYSNATATLAGIVDLLSIELTIVLQFVADWSNISVLCKAALNKDFVSAGIGAQKLVALLQAYLQGGISYDTFYKNLAEGEVADPLKDPKKEMAAIKAGLDNIRKALGTETPPDDNNDQENDDGTNGAGTEG